MSTRFYQRASSDEESAPLPLRFKANAPRYRWSEASTLAFTKTDSVVLSEARRSEALECKSKDRGIAQDLNADSRCSGQIKARDPFHRL